MCGSFLSLNISTEHLLPIPNGTPGQRNGRTVLQLEMAQELSCRVWRCHLLQVEQSQCLQVQQADAGIQEAGTATTAGVTNMAPSQVLAHVVADA